MVSRSTYVSALALGIWFTGRRGRSSWFVAALVVAIGCWVNGKRHIVAIFAIVLIYSLAEGRALRRGQIMKGAVTSAIALATVLAVSFRYQATYRPVIAREGVELESFLIDFSRLGVLNLSWLRLPASPSNRRLNTRAIVWCFIFKVSVSCPAPTRSSRTRTALRRCVRDCHRTALGLDHYVTSLGDDRQYRGLAILIGPAILGAALYLVSRHNDPVLSIIGGLAVAMLVVVHVLAILPIVLLAIGRAVRLFSPKPPVTELASHSLDVSAVGLPVGPPAEITFPQRCSVDSLGPGDVQYIGIASRGRVGRGS